MSGASDHQAPPGWIRTDLGEVVEIIMGQAPAGTDCNKSGTGDVFVKAGEFGLTHPTVREWTTKPLKFARTTDVLLCVVGATSGKLNYGIDCAIGRSVAALRPTSGVAQRYLYNFLLTRVLSLRTASNGSAQGMISRPDIHAIRLVS